MIGETVGEYKIVGQLVPGTTGDVYIGTHKDQGTRAAIEVLHTTVSANADATAKYLATVRAVSNIKHGGTIKLADAGADPAGRTYVVMELLDGETLARRIETSGRLSLTQIGEIGRQLALALAATHDDGIVHGDLRPDVVFLMAQGGLSRGEPIKITDWGVADLKRAVGIEIGPVYSAPELLGSGEPVDWRVDAYGLGCIVYEMATGKPPFAGANADEVRLKHREAVPPSARALMPDVAPALDQLIGRLLSKKPEDRYASMREIARLFEPFGTTEKPLAPTADLPVVGVEKQAAAGELRAKAPTKEPTVDMGSSIQIEGPEAAQAVVTEAPPPLMPSPVGITTQRTPKQAAGGPKLAIIVIMLVLLAGGAVAVAFAMRG